MLLLIYNYIVQGPVYALSPREYKDREDVVHPLQTGVYATWLSEKEKISSEEVSMLEGIAHFDTTPTFPSVALFLDATFALILKEWPGGAYIRVGTVNFWGKTEEIDKVAMRDGAIREVTIV